MYGSATSSSSAVSSSISSSSAPSAFIPAKSDEGLSTADQAIAAMFATVGAKGVLYPLDTWKSRRQALRLVDSRGVWTVAGMYRGFAPKMVLYMPYQAVYMAVYVRARDTLVTYSVCPKPVSFVLAGVTAEVVGAVIRLPMEVAKVRLQLGLYKNTWSAAVDFARRPRVLFRNFVPQTLMHDCLYSATSWLVYETTRQRVFAGRGVGELHSHESLAIGTVTGAVSALVTTPCDVLKTRVIAEVSNRRASTKLRAVISDIWRTEGPRVLWRGAWLRMAHLAPSHGMYMWMYEMAKTQIATWRRSPL